MTHNPLRIAVMVTLLSLFHIACSTGGVSGSGTCPQPRSTVSAPNFVLDRDNPLPATADTLKAGKKLYMETSGDVACVQCHGKNLDGNGPMAAMFDPPPRNFTCQNTMEDIAEGQLFWTIKYGSPGTSMPAFNTLYDEQIWQLVHYIRSAGR